MLNKKNLFPIIALTVIGVVVAGLLAAINLLTQPVIAETERLAVLESLQTVMPGGDFGGDEIVPEKLDEDAPETVQAVYKEKTGKGHVVILKAQGYASVISITVGVDNEGKITRAIVTSEQESHGQAGMKDYPDSFTGLNAGGVAGAPLYSGATISSGAIRGAIVDAMYVLGYVTDTGDTEEPEIPLPKTDSEIKAIAESYVGGAVVECELGADAPKTLKRLYRHEASGSYIAYNITSTKYVAVETEGFVVIDKNGVITDIDMLTWTVGHGVNPPENYTDTFIGRDKFSIISSDLVSTATGTSTNFAAAVHGALEYTSPDSSWQSVIGIVILSLSVATAVACFVVYKVRRKTK